MLGNVGQALLPWYGLHLTPAPCPWFIDDILWYVMIFYDDVKLDDGQTTPAPDPHLAPAPSIVATS